MTRMKLLHLQKLRLLGDRSVTAKKAQFCEQQARLCHYILQKRGCSQFLWNCGALGVNGYPL